jgi:hypothetical protein
MVGSVLTLVILLFNVGAAAAQTYTQMQWGMNKGVTPYQFGANINGTWTNLGTVSPSGVWSIPTTNISGLGTAASYNIGTSGGTVPLLNASNTWTPLQTFSAGITGLGTVSAGVWTVAQINVAPTFESLGLVPNSTAAAVANCNAINNLIDQANNSNKKIIVLPGGRLPDGSKATIYVGCSIDMKYSGITLTSPANDDYHNRPPVNAPAQIAAFGMTTPIIKMRSPYGPTNTRMTGMHLSNIVIEAAGSTAPAVDVDSIAASSIKNVYILNSHAQTLAAMYFHVGVEGVDLGETTTIQNFVTENVDFRQLDDATARNTSCVRFDGSSNSNFSVNDHVEFNCVHYDATAYVIYNADNTFFNLRASRGAGGVGATLLCAGENPFNPPTYPTGCDGNTFQYLQGAGAVIFEGTNTAGVTKGMKNQIAWLDKGNGTPDPTVGTDSVVDYTSNIGWRSAFPFTKTAIADSGALARYCYGRITFESLRICNGSSSQLIFDNGGLTPAATAVFGQRINGTTFEFINLTGGGGYKFVPPVEFVNPVTFSSLIALKAYTVAGLAAVPCVAGRTGNMAYVTDATAPTYNGALTGGGAVIVPVFCNGTAWSSH